ncbi:MAG TPA: LytR C-terminal domain-containing protein [Patescibacteria group bacterium]|nr:LytR C-terminal domain-containing protein [Patescibacteria group bacterium]
MRTSKYDPNHTIVISFVYKNDLDLLALHPNDTPPAHVSVRGASSPDAARGAVDILTDVTVELPQPFSQVSNVSQYFWQAFQHRGAKTNLNSYDLVRLALATRGLSNNTVEDATLHLPHDQSLELAQNFFSDKTIMQENKTIAIVNGTQINGLGTRLESALDALGGNVISVTNSSIPNKKSSLIYVGEKSYTSSHLSSLLHIPAQSTSHQGLSDIIIVVGQDQVKNLLK